MIRTACGAAIGLLTVPSTSSMSYLHFGTAAFEHTDGKMKRILEMVKEHNKTFMDRVVKMYDAEDLKPSGDCVKMVKHFEGFSATPYHDSAGVLTWGYGETVGVDPNGTISEAEASKRFLWRLEDDYASYIPKVIEVPITQGMYDAMACFIYNIGGGAFTSSTLAKKLNRKDYEGAGDEFLKWVYAGGEKLNGLVRRRESERRMFLGQNWEG